jgi:hypothetical protein
MTPPPLCTPDACDWSTSRRCVVTAPLTSTRRQKVQALSLCTCLRKRVLPSQTASRPCTLLRKRPLARFYHLALFYLGEDFPPDTHHFCFRVSRSQNQFFVLARPLVQYFGPLVHGRRTRLRRKVHVDIYSFFHFQYFFPSFLSSVCIPAHGGS